MSTYSADDKATTEEEFGCHTPDYIQALAYWEPGYNQCFAQFAKHTANYTLDDIQASAHQKLGDSQQFVQNTVNIVVV